MAKKSDKDSIPQHPPIADTLWGRFDELASVAPIRQAMKDVRASERLITAVQARYLVDNFYMIQRNRIRTHNQEEALIKADEPADLVKFVSEQDAKIERYI